MTTDIRKTSGLPHWAVFVVGLATIIRLDAVGYLFGSEILLALLAFGLLATKKKTRHRTLLIRALVSMALLCVVIVITDRLRHVSLVDSAKGVALYVSIALSVTGLFVICGKDLYRQMIFLIGMCVGTILQFALFGGFLFARNQWKFGYGAPTTVLVCALAGTAFGVSIWTGLIMVLMAMVNLVLDFRSTAGLCLFAGVGVMIAPFIRRQFRRPSYKVLVAGGLVGLVLVSGFSALYKFAASSGLMNRKGEHRYLIQNAAEGGFLLAGRADLIGAALAIRKSPIIGFGSAAEDPQIARLTIYMQTIINPALEYHKPDTTRIPTHSFLLGAWVQIGIVGALFWAAWFMLITRVGVDTLWLPDTLVSGWLFFILLELWNTLASPLAGFHRLEIAIVINFVITVIALRQSKRRHG